MKIGIFSDIHGNLPALKVILNKFNSEKCDYIYSLGDTIAIGPFPKECIELLLSLENIKFIMGNHEEYFVKGISNLNQAIMSKGEIAHQTWVHSLLKENIRKSMSKFPYKIEKNIEGVKVVFLHYPLNNGEVFKTFKDIEKDVTIDNLDKLFEEVDGELIFYGHEHSESNIKGKKHYVNVGSSGCTKDDITHCTIVEFKENSYDIKTYKMKCDKEEVFKGLEKSEVPEKEFISKVFFGK